MKIKDLFEAAETLEPKERSVLSVHGEQPDPHKGSFACNHDRLTSLHGSPKTMIGEFCCSNNDLTSLEGAPSIIQGPFDCSNNDLTSLKGIHKIIKHIGKSADFGGNPIKSHVLGLLMIDGLNGVNLKNKKVEKIVNKHLKSGRDAFACQEELSDAGLDAFAQI